MEFSGDRFENTTSFDFWGNIALEFSLLFFFFFILCHLISVIYSESKSSYKIGLGRIFFCISSFFLSNKIIQIGNFFFECHKKVMHTDV